MFGGAIPGFQPSAEARAASERTFQLLVDAVQDAIAAGWLGNEDSHLVAAALWATVHGVVSLQLAGSLPEPRADAVFTRAMRAVSAGFRPTDEREA